MSKVNYSSLIQMEFQRIELSVDASTVLRLTKYCEELERWNEKVNLTALRDGALVRRLIVEPIWIGQKLDIRGTVCDVGSGNGSPAIPICLAQLAIETLHLTEIRAKKAAFLRHVTSFLHIDHAHVHREKFEDAVQAIGPVDWITMQAVDPTESILKAAKAISKETTRVVWITSGGGKEHTGAAKSILKLPLGDTQAIVFG